MNLEAELRELLGRADETPWPGEAGAYDRFLRRRRRRGRVVAATTACLALVAVLAGVVLVPHLRPSPVVPAVPGPTRVRVESQGYELQLPAGWKVERELMGTHTLAAGEVFPATSIGVPQPAVVGLVLVPRSGRPEGARITITTDLNERLDYSVFRGGSRRADGREYRLHPGANPGEVGRYAVMWLDFCYQKRSCGGSIWPRILWITGSAPSDKDGVLAVMKRIVGALRPITNSKRPPPPPTVPRNTNVLIGTGGSGRTAWEARIEPLGGGSGFSMRFPWLQEHGKKGQGMHWESLEPRDIQQQGTWTLMDCLSWWSPGSGVLLSGLARKEVAAVRFELEGQAPATVPTFGRDKGLPWVAYVLPFVPKSSRIQRVVALDGAGKEIGEERAYQGDRLCGEI
jgi:hypothetical protein